MDVIRHDDVAADRNVEFVPTAKRVSPKRFVREIESLDPPTMQSTKGYEEQWRSVGLKNLHQPWGAAFNHSKRYKPSELLQIGVEAAVPAATFLDLRATRPPLHQGWRRAVMSDAAIHQR
jgi:hypothetical protein